MTWLRPRGDRGEISLPGLLTASVLSLMVLTAVLTTFENAQSQSTELTARNANQQQARQASDRLALELRNLASPTPDQPQAVDRAQPFDLIFQNVDPAGPNLGLNLANVRRERYCLTTGGRLYAQQQTWTSAAVPPAPAATACPGAGWTRTTVAADRLRNRQLNPVIPLFTYDAAAATDIAAINVDLQLDEDPARGTPYVRMATGVFLRNQNRRPVASFTAVKTAQGIVLNASGSSDPEGHVLQYTWLDGAVVVGTGITLTYKPAAGTVRQLSVRVTDPSGLAATAPVQAVTA